MYTPTKKLILARIMFDKLTCTRVTATLREWFSRHGIPEHMATDNGPQFITEEFETFTHRNGIKHIRSAPYHPGLAE